MESIRITPSEPNSCPIRCSRCSAGNARWDLINGVPYCPNCQEELVQGEGTPLTLRTAKHRCTICQHQGTVCFRTHPLGTAGPVEMELCAEHLRALMGRSLQPAEFHQLGRQLQALGVQGEDVFLLHGAFYDAQGNAVFPALDLDERYRRAG